jgi:hypothetical protein
MSRTPLPSHTWEFILADFLSPLPSGHHLFVVYDYYSRYTEVAIVKSVTAAMVIDLLMDMFSGYLLPLHIATDNSPCFIEKNFQQFLQD